METKVLVAKNKAMKAKSLLGRVVGTIGVIGLAVENVLGVCANNLITSVNVTAATDVDAGLMMNKIIGLLLSITRYAGLGLLVFGLYEVVMSFIQQQPEAKTKGIIMALCGVIMIALKSILKAMNIVG